MKSNSPLQIGYLELNFNSQRNIAPLHILNFLGTLIIQKRPEAYRGWYDCEVTKESVNVDYHPEITTLNKTFEIEVCGNALLYMTTYATKSQIDNIQMIIDSIEFDANSLTDENYFEVHTKLKGSTICVVAKGGKDIEKLLCGTVFKPISKEQFESITSIQAPPRMGNLEIKVVALNY